MSCAVAVRIGGKSQDAILHFSQVYQIISSQAPGIEISKDGGFHCLKVENESFPILNWNGDSSEWPYFLILTSKQALGIEGYSFIYRLRVLPDGCLSGKDINGSGYSAQPLNSVLSSNNLSGKGSGVWPMSPGRVCEADLDSLENLVEKIRQGEFYAALTEELSEKIKKIADEMIAFRKDLQKKIEPSIVGLVINEIPETSNELEGINETLEKSTMKIMDINDEILGLCANRLQEFSCLVSELAMVGEGKGEESTDQGKAKSLEKQLMVDRDMATKLIEKHIESFEKIRNLSMNMTEPLCFQDLVGQRIQKIVRLVKSMEERIKDLVETLGVRLQEYKKAQDIVSDHSHDNAEGGSVLKGPQKEGEGLNQSAVDELLASL